MEIINNFSLRPLNSFGIDAHAKLFASFSTKDRLQEIAADKIMQENRLLVLGGGSNVLLTKDFDGLVLKNELGGIDVINESEEHVVIKAGAGENWHRLVMHTVDLGLGGIENLSLIPGNAGASPMQNIGAYGVEIKDVFEELEAFHIKEQKFYRFNKEACAFGYRESVFKNDLRNQFVITGITLRLSKKPVFNTSYGAIQQELEAMGVTELTVKAVSQAVINIRSSKLPDPARLGNAGSFFKNPVVNRKKYAELKSAFPAIAAFPFGDEMKLAAGWLIEQCGWKGYRKGDAGCYPKQALVLVNYGSASGKEILELSTSIIQSVKEKFGVELEREVNVV